MSDETTSGVFIFAGMQIGVAPGDLFLGTPGGSDSRLTLSTAYNVVPLWLRVAQDEVRLASAAHVAIGEKWSGADAERRRELLIAELKPCLQVFVACGIALDALYDQLRPFAKLSERDIEKWRAKRTARSAQIAEVMRRVYRLDAALTSSFKGNLANIFEWRDKAVHPSLALAQTCTRPDLLVGVDWKFAAYRFDNAAVCFTSTMEMLLHLSGRQSHSQALDKQMKHIVEALIQLKVVEPSPPVTPVESRADR